MSIRHWLILAAAVTPPASTRAQELRPDAHAIEVHVSERRMNGRQQPRFTPFVESDEWFYVDSMQRRKQGRTLFVSIQGSRDVRGELRTTSDGHLSSVSIHARPARRLPFETSRDVAHFERASLFVDFGDDRLALPAAKLWDLVPTFHPSRLSLGAQWTDSLSFAAESLGNRQRWAGTRDSRIVGDTTIKGKQMWIVSDVATVRYDERALVDERTLDTLVPISRGGTATIRGRMIYDPSLGLAYLRDDSLRFAGTAELRYPDGRTFETPAHDERIRHMVLYDAREYGARRAAIQAERERTASGGVVIVPTNPVDERLSKGDTIVRDSLVRRWRASTSPNEREQLFERLTFWDRGDTAFIRPFKGQRIAEGDTVFLLQELASASYTERHAFGPVDTTHMRQLIAVMSDPGLLFAFHVDRDPFYEDLAQALYTTPPVITRDTTQWPCTPAACRMLANQWRTASETRLQQVALVAHFVLDPRTWTDTLLANARSGAPLLAEPLYLARGVANTSRAGSKALIPSANADWRAWAEWMSGRDSAYARAVASMPQFAPTNSWLPIDFQGVNVAAIRFTEVRTGRDIVGELRHQLERAGNDSARLVYEYLLTGLGAYQPTPASVAALLRSTSQAKRILGIQEVVRLFSDTTPNADPATTDSLQDALIATAFQLGRRWRSLQPIEKRPPEFAPSPMREADVERTFLLADSISPGLRAKWASRVRLISQAEWAKRSDREGGTLYTPTHVARVGPFARVGIESAGSIPRKAEQAPWLYFGGTTYYLMQLDGEWVLVTASQWIT